MAGKVVAAFTGTGKSFVSKLYDGVADIDLGNYRFVYDGPEDIPFEARKAMKKYDVQPEWPQNYFNAIMESIGKNDVVLVTYCPEVEEFLYSKGIIFYYFVPKESAWEAIEKRLRNRGNNDRFIEITKARLVNESRLSSNKMRKMSFEDDEFLESALLRNGFLNPNKKRRK